MPNHGHLAGEKWIAGVTLPSDSLCLQGRKVVFYSNSWWTLWPASSLVMAAFPREAYGCCPRCGVDRQSTCDADRDAPLCGPSIHRVEFTTFYTFRFLNLYSCLARLVLNPTTRARRVVVVSFVSSLLHHRSPTTVIRSIVSKRVNAI